MASEPATAVDRRDRALAAGCGVLAFAAYVRTLAPGLTADPDSPLFQFIGRVLGVAHNPGYPLYALLTWPVAQIPIGSLAWRINFFSAALGGLAVAIGTIAARRLGCRRSVAAVAALGFAAGGTFWAQAVVAEVYTLHLVLVAALLQSALAWRVSRRPRHFYAAVAWLAVGLGHHTTIAAFAPAIALQALLVDWRFALRLRTIATSAALCVAGLLPYLLVLVRSRDPQAYVESRATDLDGLAGVLLGAQFRDRLFTESWAALAGQRFPELVARVFRPDLTLVGLVLAAIGIVWLLRRRLPDAALLLTGAAIITAFVVNYQVVDQHVFLLPVVLCLWLCAAVGLDALIDGAEHLLPALGATPTRRALTGALALALPIWLAVQHGPRVDRSGDRDDGRHVERLMAALPARAAIAGGDFIVDRMVQYELRGVDAGAGRDLRIAPRDAAAIAELHRGGATVVAFPGAVDRLRLDGLDFSAAPVRLVDGALDRVVGELPRGSIVALAIPAAHVKNFAATTRRLASRLGTPAAWATGIAEHVAIAVVGGAARAASTPGAARLVLAPGESGWIGRAPIEVEAGRGEAAIRAGGRDLLRTADGVAVAIWDPAGAFVRAFVLIDADGYQVPLATTAFSAYRLLGEAEARDVAAGNDVDLTPLASTGSLTVTVPPDGVLTLDAFDAALLAPYVVDNPAAARVDVGAAPVSTGSRITIAAGPAQAALFLTLGGVPERLVGRLTAPGLTVARVRRGATTGLLRGPDWRSAVLRMTRDDQTQLIGAGWSAVETDDAGPYRWMRGREARLTLPATSTAWRRLSIEAFRDGIGGGATLAVRVNGLALEPRPLQPGWQTCAWDLPPAVSDALGRAPADVRVVLSNDAADATRQLAVASLRVSDSN